MSHPSPVPRLERPPLLPPDWQELAPLIDTVLDAAPDRREALLRELCPGDPDRRRAVERLVAECECDTPLLDRPAAERFKHLTNDLPISLLPDLVAERYRTGRELGRGGMARVYLARDLKHDRDVAIKVIRPELSASLGHDRFLRETEIAARLRHPNIVPLYDSGEVGGSLYFVMPYEEGQSLRERLAQDGALPIADALNVLRDVARALCYAHEHGVVHRDVKPDNVMLSGGAAVVTDFGIAKAVSAALTDGGAQTLTQTGSAIGTPAYMAPEQAVGDPSTDHRADIYSFGCLAYELFTGKPPFHGMPTHEVIAGHVGSVPPRVTVLRADVHASVGDLVARCLEKHPDARPQSARELLSALDGVPMTRTPAPSPAASVPRRRRVLPWAGLMLAVAVISMAAYFVNRTASLSAPITITVLPFYNTAADSAIDLIASGLADEVASALARVRGIQIVSRNGARAYRGQLTVNVAEVAKTLKAEYVMTGSVRQEDGRWLLSAVVERGVDAASLWDSTFNVSPDQQVGAAEAIAGSLTSALRERFPKSIGPVTVLAANERTLNPEAYRLNMRGQEILTRRSQTVKEGVDLFRKAIREDPRYAQAYSGLSMALSLTAYMDGVPMRDLHDDLVGAARRAIELDSTLAQPHVALGVAYWFDYSWDKAEAEFKNAIRLDGRNVEARIQYARHLRFRGQNSDAMRELRVARALDPMSAVVLSHLAYSYSLDLQLDSALKESGRAWEMDPTNVTTVGYRALILLRVNRPEEARALVNARRPSLNTDRYVLARVDPVAARQRLQDLDAERPQRWGAETNRVMIYLGVGDTALALSALERATDSNEIWHAGAVGYSDPLFDAVRGSARFQATLRRVRLAR